MSIKIDDFLEAVQGELAEYANEVTEDVKESVKDVAKETVKEVKRRSPVRSGAYKKSWGQTKVYEGTGGIRITIHNKKHYQLTHVSYSVVNLLAGVNAGVVFGWSSWHSISPHTTINRPNLSKKVLLFLSTKGPEGTVSWTP